MWARIENGAVAEITDIDPAGRFHPSLPWVGCSDEVTAGWLYDGAAFSEPPVVLPTPAEQRGAVAAKRYDRETAGIAVSGMRVDTGRDSQALITGAALQATIDPAYVCRWKLADGSRVDLDAASILGLAIAVRSHVQACFDREDELLTAIESGEYTSAMLEEGWPDGSVPVPYAG